MIPGILVGLLAFALALAVYMRRRRSHGQAAPHPIACFVPPPSILNKMRQGNLVMRFEENLVFPAEYLLFESDRLIETAWQFPRGDLIFHPMAIDEPGRYRRTSEFTPAPDMAPDPDAEPEWEFSDAVRNAFRFEIVDEMAKSGSMIRWDRTYTVLYQGGRLSVVLRELKCFDSSDNQLNGVNFVGGGVRLTGFQCSHCQRESPAVEVHLMPAWFGGRFSATYQCDQCWPAGLSTSKAALADGMEEVRHEFCNWIADWFQDEELAAPMRTMPLPTFVEQASKMLDKFAAKGGLDLE